MSTEKRRERSSIFFTNKKNGKYKRKTTPTTNTNTTGKCDKKKFEQINFVLSDISLVFVQQQNNNDKQQPFPSARDFFTKIKQTFSNPKIVLFTHNKVDIILAKQFFPLIDLFVELDKSSVSMEERPILYLRKYLFRKRETVSGPNILITKTMNANNHKQYDIVKDIRRFYKFEDDLLVDVNYQLLIDELEKSINDLSTR